MCLKSLTNYLLNFASLVSVKLIISALGMCRKKNETHSSRAVRVADSKAKMDYCSGIDSPAYPLIELKS